MQTKQGSKFNAFSWIKSKEKLEQLTNNIHRHDKNNNEKSNLRPLHSATRKLQQTIEVKIEDNFNSMMNTTTVMQIAPKPEYINKEIFSSVSMNSIEGMKSLMHHYWEKDSKNENEGEKFKAKKAKKISMPKENRLPSINSPSNKSHAYFYSKYKENNHGRTPKNQNIENYHTNLIMKNYQCNYEAQDYQTFKQSFKKRWQEIQYLIRTLEKFAEKYELNPVELSTKMIIKLLDKVKISSKKTLSPHEFLNCFLYADKLSQESNKPAIKYFGKSGKIRAIVKVQSFLQKLIYRKRYQKQRLKLQKLITIQRYFRIKMVYKQTKQRIFQRQLQKIDCFNKMQDTFKQQYRKNEITKKLKYEIHVPSKSFTQWQRVTTQKYTQFQNSQLCRIFKLASQNNLNQTRIIYISPVELQPEVVNYYKKIFHFGDNQKWEEKLYFLVANGSSKYPHNISLSRQLYYCSKTLKKIKSIVKGHYAYLVPSVASNDYMSICTELQVPLYSGNIQKLLYYQTKAGSKQLASSIQPTDAQKFGILPFCVDIYSKGSFLNELTNLVFNYPFIKRWVMKIDHEFNSRGVAFLDVQKIIPRSLFERVRIQKQTKKSQKQLREEIYQIFENTLMERKQQRIRILCKQVYGSQEQFLNHFLNNGGIIEASINNFESDLQNQCFSVNLEPDGQWRTICSYIKITNKNKAIGCYFSSQNAQTPKEVEDIIGKLKKEGLFGYFSFQFLRIPAEHQKVLKKSEPKLTYLNSIECCLNEYTSSFFLKDYVSPTGNALFTPKVVHPSLKDLRFQTFFHLCRLQNISFDISRKVGNIFTFMDSLQSSTLGVMSFNQANKEDCYASMSQVLEFFNKKLASSKEVPKEYFEVKNAINGYLNRIQKFAFKSQSKKSITTIK